MGDPDGATANHGNVLKSSDDATDVRIDKTWCCSSDRETVVLRAMAQQRLVKILSQSHKIQAVLIAAPQIYQQLSTHELIIPLSKRATILLQNPSDRVVVPDTDTQVYLCESWSRCCHAL